MKKIFQKFLCIALAASIVTAMMPKLTAYAETLNWKDSTDGSWYSESEANYKIGTAQQLAGFAKLVNGGISFTGKTVTLTSDIDLAGREWTPIGTDVGNRFQGAFDGQTHVISNLTIGSPDNPNPDLLYLGLFGYLSQTDGAAVRQVGIENAKIYSSHADADAGGLAGLVANASSESKDLHLEKTYVTGGIYAGGSGSCAGGGIGKVNISYNHGYFYYMNSYASCDVSAQLYAGGLLGYSATCGTNYTGLMCNRDKEQTVAGKEVAAADRKLFGLDRSFGGALDKTHCLTASEMKTDTFLCNSSMSTTNFGSINYGIYYSQIGFGLREGENDGLPILKMLLRPLNVGDSFTGGDGYTYTATSVGDKKEAKFTSAASASGVLTIPSVTSYDDVPYHVTAVGDYALYGQTALTGLTISSGVTAIGDKAFYNCTNLESVSIADSVKTIGEMAFYNCGIKSLELANGLTGLGNWAFFGCKNLKSVALPDSLTTCGSSIFRECTALESINIPSGLTAISTEMLMGTSLESITLPESITSVGMYALSSCPKLKSITFLGNLQKIDQDAFSNNPLLKTIVFKSAVPPTTIYKGGIFFGDPHPIYGQVPSGSVEAYQTAFSAAYYSSYYIKFGDQPLQLCAGETFTAPNSGTVITYKVTSASPATVEVAAGSPAYSGSVIIPGSVKGSDGYTYQVTGIGSGAFSGCGGLTSAVLPSGVAAVGNQAFSGCTALTELTFEGGVPKTVGTDVFTGDRSVTCVVPPVGLESYKTALLSYISGGQVTVKSGAYADGFQFAEKNEKGVSIRYQVISAENKTVEVIANSPSYSGEVIIPASVIGEDGNTYAVTVIGQKAFLDCSGLSGISLPESIASIDDWAFENCSKLTGVTVPDNVTQIGKYAFKGCKGLTEIRLPANLASLGVCSFMNCTGLESVTIPDKIPEIAQQTFDGCTKLKTISIGSGVTSIGDMAFMGCSGLADITIPAGVESVGQSAFMGAGLTGITFKGDVSSIGDCAFYFAPQIAKITFEGSVPPKTVGKDLFANDTYPVRAVVPAGTVTAYETAFSAYTQCDPVQLKFEEKPGLAAPSGLAWDGTAAKWDKVAAATGYTVTLYKDGKAVASENVSQDTLTYDFKNDIKDSSGNYTFKVVAKGSASVSDSAESAASGEYKEESGGSGVISSFDPLTSYGKTVSYGTSYEELGLPTVLKAVVDNISDQIVSVIEWVSSTAFDGNKAGTYDFTPVLDSGYQIKDSGVKLPHIAVTVTAKEESRHSDSTEQKQPQTPKTEVRVDSAANTSTVTTAADSVSAAGDTAQISATVPDIATDTSGANTALDAGKKARIEINLPKEAIVQQLAAKKDVDLTLTVPSSVAENTGANTAVDIKVNSDILTAAKTNESDVTIKIKDADTQQLAYSWTFKGADLAKSVTPVTDVNISMAVRLTTEVAQVNRVTPNNVGLVLVFDHSGVLPSTANVTFSAKEKGFKPGQTLYFYFYNPTTGQIDPENRQYTVDANGMVTVQISHCSNYVLLPHSARTIMLDTRTYTMPVGSSYETGVKLSGALGAKMKAYSSTKGVADVTVLKNGNVKATGLKPGLTYIMVDVYDSKNKFLTHASVRLTVQNGVKANGNSARQYGIF